MGSQPDRQSEADLARPTPGRIRASAALWRPATGNLTCSKTYASKRDSHARAREERGADVTRELAELVDQLDEIGGKVQEKGRDPTMSRCA
jgi:hypothetical protein